MSWRRRQRGHHSARLALLLAALLLAVLGGLPAAAQDEEAPQNGELPTPAALEERLETWRAEVEQLRRPESEEADAAPPAELAAAEEAASLLEDQLEAAREAARLEEESEELAGAIEAGPSAELGESPYSFQKLDQVLDRRDALAQAETLATDAVEAAVQVLDEAEARLRSGLGAAGGWETRGAEVGVELARQRLANARANQQLTRQRHERARSLISHVSENLQVRPQALDDYVRQLEDQRLRLESRRRLLEREADLAERRWHDVQARLERSSTPVVEAEAAARRAALDLADARLKLLGDRLERLQLEEEAWRRRFEIALDTESKEGSTTLDSLAKRLDRSSRERSLRLGELRQQRRALSESALSNSAQSEPSREDAASGESAVDSSIDPAVERQVTKWRERHRETLTEAIDAYEDDLADVRRVSALVERVQSESSGHRWRPVELVGSAWNALQSAWSFELTVVEGRPVTLGKAFLALLLILIGYRFSKYVASSFGRLLEKRLQIGSGAAAALQNLVLYALLVIFFLWAFQLVGIPLTAFTVVGGVVAIGVGFGSQNIVNNFISGLILLIERPIKVGDLIEVDGVLGSVERIGLRSTRVRAGDNTHVIVPNSSFLEKNVLNWTVSDDVIRTHVDVGVAYGSPTEEVKRLIEKALGDEPAVLRHPAWDVLFIEFGDNALHFRAYFWIRVHGFLDRVRAGSSLRFRIDQLFRDAEITISFPQRDVHLDSLSPVEVRLLDHRTAKGEE